MRIDVIMPQMGESIAEGTITKWLKQAGDSVERDEMLFEISTDKVDTEIPSPTQGVLAEILVQEGETVPILTVVASIETESQAAVQSAARGPGASVAVRDGTAKQEPTPSSFPALLPGGSEEAPTHEVRVVSHTWEKMPQEVSIRIPQSAPTIEPQRTIRSSPVVRELAQEYGVDLRKVLGTGIRGRITKRDVLSYIENQTAGGTGAPAFSGDVETIEMSPSTSPRTAPLRSSAEERLEIVPMTAMRKRIAEHMTTSKRTSAHVSTVFEVDLTRVQGLRSQWKADFQRRHGINLTSLPFIIRSSVDALRAFPILNASVEEDKIIYKKDINIGVAVALDWGLIVPVIKNSDEKSLTGLAKAVSDLATRARNKQLTPEDVQGGTFTITNPGLFGSLFGTPIINQPQVAILGIGRITRRLVVIEDDAIAIRSMAYFTLTFDHRIIDGAVADQFMARVKRTLEQPDFALD
jgi:2-oxoglutarate dehydrogenase E2 component (dihydrolipoamide succinyltransferase)